MRLTELSPDPEAAFPAIETALDQPDGLLAWGGDLSPPRLLNAYRHGCFPWYERGQPILWWSPDPRLVLTSRGFHLARRFARFLRGSDWTVRADSAFDQVIRACAGIRRSGQRGTWIVPAMVNAYERLHTLGHGHSIEVCDGGGRLVGGVYGLSIGRMFFGESMFSSASNGSKTALLALCRFLAEQGMPVIDCQMDTDHLRSLGARLIERRRFVRVSRRLCDRSGPDGSWQQRFGVRPARDLLDFG